MDQQQVIIHCDPEKMDFEFIYSFLSASLWAKGITREDLSICMDNSLNFGIHINEKQIGFARVVTDYVMLAYLMDVFIDPAYQKQGHSKTLMIAIMDHPKLKNIKRWRLRTGSAHYLYEKFGFSTAADPQNHMEKIRND